MIIYKPTPHPTSPFYQLDRDQSELRAIERSGRRTYDFEPSQCWPHRYVNGTCRDCGGKKCRWDDHLVWEHSEDGLCPKCEAEGALESVATWLEMSKFKYALESWLVYLAVTNNIAPQGVGSFMRRTQ